MKHNNLPSAIIAILLSSLISFSGICCLATGFQFEHVNYLLLFLLPSIFALFCSLSLHKRAVFWSFWPTAALLLGWLLWKGDLLLSIEALLYRISRYYHGGYGCGVIYWSGHDLLNVDLTPALILLGCMVVLPLHHMLLRRKWLGFGLIPGVVPVLLCCIVTDTVPAPAFLCLFIIGILLLVMTQLLRRQNTPGTNRITALLLIPVILFSSVLCSTTAKDPHAYQAQQLQNRFVAFLADITSGIQLPGPGIFPSTGAQSATVNLRNVGPRNPGNSHIMSVETDYAGYLYLRGQAYDCYTGTSWEATVDTTLENGWPDPVGKELDISISTAAGFNIKYFPYHLVDSRKWTLYLTNGAYINESKIRNYSFEWIPPDHTMPPHKNLTAEEEATYTALPEDTLTAAQAILEDVFQSEFMYTQEKAAAIAGYVRTSATYDLDTPSMPADGADFAIWFLEEASTGYCVHFASAATVLLRAAGIPARYVTGYLTYTIPGSTSSVTAEQSHAWVEYLDPQQGWTVLEATPGAESIAPRPTTEPTVPSESTIPSESTQPSESTSPEESTEPDPSDIPDTLPPVTTQPSTTPSTQPSDDTGTTGQWAGQVLQVLLPLLAVWLVLAGQRRLRLYIRHQRLTQGSRKRQALRRWKYACRMAKLIKQPPPKELKFLAEKAAFSQHRLTHEELRQFDKWTRDAQQVLLQKPWPLRVLLRLIFAI